MSLKYSIYSLFGLHKHPEQYLHLPVQLDSNPTTCATFVYGQIGDQKKRTTNRLVKVVWSQVHCLHKNTALVVLVSGYNARDAYGIQKCTKRDSDLIVSKHCCTKAHQCTLSRTRTCNVKQVTNNLVQQSASAHNFPEEETLTLHSL